MLLSMVFLFNGCSKKDKDDDGLNDRCDELYTDWYNKLITLSTNPTEANCEAYKDALQDFIEGCTYYTGINRAELQQELDEIDCSEYGSGK